MLKRFAPVLVVLATAVSLVGCGAGAAAKNNAISVTTTDFKFEPVSWTVDKGQTVSLTLKNEGKLEHEWVIIKQGEQVTMPFNDDDEAKVFWEIEAAPGQTKTEEFSAPTEAGTYTVVCGTPAHLEAGMTAALVVK
jgi:uncharacterized cupredoxin-like copper-binding protein